MTGDPAGGVDSRVDDSRDVHSSVDDSRGVDSSRVVLLGDDGGRIGTASKASVHDADTPLHLGFSCHVLVDDDRVLVTRRALTKSHLEETTIPIPPLTEQRRISAVLDVAEGLEAEISELTRTRDELLPLLMSGKVRISESLAVA